MPPNLRKFTSAKSVDTVLPYRTGVPAHRFAPRQAFAVSPRLRLPSDGPSETMRPPPDFRKTVPGTSGVMSGQLTLHDPPLRHPFFSVAGFPYPQSPSAGTAEVLTDAPYSWLSASEHRLGAMASPCTCEEENVLALGALQASTPLQTVLIPRKVRARGRGSALATQDWGRGSLYNVASSWRLIGLMRIRRRRM